MNMQKKNKLWQMIKLLFIGITILLTSAFLWASQLSQEMDSRLKKGWFLPPVEFYAAPLKIKVGQKVSLNKFSALMQRHNWLEREATLSLRPGDWKVIPDSDCREQMGDREWPVELERCLGFWDPQLSEPHWLALHGETVVALFSGSQPGGDWVELPGEKFAQYHNGQPILQNVVDLAEVPLECSQAVTAIEDVDFLSHPGISITGILRAFGRNVARGRFAEGASTITQQLVKNYFLTPEKTIKRKIKEQLMALLLELRSDKDSILSNYINIVYMGQDGVFQIRGLGAAADYFFGKRLRDLKLPECALMAAMINNPGRYNPLVHPEKALSRRNLVLSRMGEQGMIDSSMVKKAQGTDLGIRSKRLLSEPAPYFVAAVFEQLKQLGIDSEEGLKVYTTLNPELQERVQVDVIQHLQNLEKRYPRLVDKNPKGHAVLQAAVLSVEVESGQVQALVGGRKYKQNQFNRVMNSHRQPGSLFKPVVYLAALESTKYSSTSILQDEPWSYKYEGQLWQPQNYDRAYRGEVTLTTALSQSLNIPTARLAVEVGLDKIINLAHQLGIQSELKALPSLSLGAFEVTPWELSQSYLTLARGGSHYPMHFLTKVTRLDDSPVYQFKADPQIIVETSVVQELQKMMQETFISGTAKVTQDWGLRNKLWVGVSGEGELKDNSLPWPSGKTGTTSDTKDSWFAGFTKDQLTLVWVGFDDNRPTHLTGSSGALPLWYQIHFP